MNKKLLITIATLLVALFAFTGCGGSQKWGPVQGANANDAVVGNGGFLVEKGDYLYFINGGTDAAVNNTFGKPVHGALVVVNKNNLDEEAKVVVPKVMVAGDKTAGIYIFGEWIYYATPNSDKDKTGTVQTTYLDFCRTKLDGTKTEKAFHVSAAATVYRYVEINGTVYLVYYDSTNTEIVTYNFATGEKNTIAEKVTSYAFSKDENYPAVYYTKFVALDEETNAVYNKVYKQSISGNDEAEVLSGVPTETDIAGSVYTILRHENGMLVYTKKHADANATAMGYVLQDAKTEVGVNNEAKAVKVCSDTTNFNAAAIVLGVDENGNSLGYIYIDSTEGLLKVVNGEFTRISNLKSGSLFFVKDNLLYYGAGTKLCSVDITKTNQGDKDVTVITETYYSTTWYLPEFVGDKVFYGDKTDELYYVYYADVTAEEIEGKFVGQYNQEAKDKIAEKEAEEALKNSVEPSTTVSAS